MGTIEIALGISVLANIIFLIGIRNLILQNEDLEDTLLETMNDIKQKVNIAYDAIKDADIRGSFESDDEVGAVFTEIKEIVEKLNETI
jgi:hypothetical protein